MSKARMESLGGGRFRVSGVLDATTVGGLLEQSGTAFAEAQQVEVDLGGVAEGDSAGLALLIEWLRAAKQRNQVIHFDHVPEQVSALARISEVEDLLSANGSDKAQATAAA